ncbi:MAG TPA: aminopeptidase P family protein [Acidimicrobiales bacterium]|jgi:Xaa-Pro aminopeptidase|nr:aminopeptidase P family protein [Acidimicrobiales bacterium]
MTALSEGSRASRRHRIELVRQHMEVVGVDALLLSHGADLPWLTGYRAMPLERLTMLVLRRRDEPVLVVPALEAPRVPEAGDLFSLLPWTDAEDPVDRVGSLLARSGDPAIRCAVSDRAWATTVLALQRRLPSAQWIDASVVTGPLRAVKDLSELSALRRAGAAADRVAATLQDGGIGLVGRTEADVSADISSLLIAEGHQHVNFAIVGSGPNAASPHHDPGGRVIGRNETVVCDFGGSYALDGDVGYCSDITRTVMTGPPSSRIADCYEVLLRAQQAAVGSARAGVAAEEVDQVARSIIGAAGLGKYFVHRTGHGIGIEEHEDPYLVSGNPEPLKPGHAFSVEPGIYLPDQFGMRLEDIVVIASDGTPEPLNSADHGLVVVDG